MIALIAGYWYARPLLLTGTGYGAHNACALHFIAERTSPETDLPPNPLVPLLRTSIDEEAGSARTAVLGLLAAQTAWYTDGFGCTVSGQAPELPAAAPVTGSNPIAEAPSPTSSSAEIEAALDTAFADGLGTRAIVVVKEGDVIAERYADGFDANTPQLGWSMAKSFASLLVGAMVEAEGIDITETDLRPEWAGEDRSEITLEHLLRMTSGLQWDETYDLGTEITRMLYLDPDMGSFAAAQPLAHGVNTYNEYSSGSTNIACDTLLTLTDSDANLPRTMLLEPLGMSTAVLEPDGAGIPVCSSYLWASPRDWAMLGQFALDDGVVDGVRILPEGWMSQSVTPTDVAEMDDANYGMSWWLNQRADGSLEVPDMPADTYWAQGHDGQRLYVIPSEDLVIARLGFSPDLGAGIGTHEFVAAVAGMD